MKETGIIMSDNHPKLILDGTKPMTRRVITPQPKGEGIRLYIGGDGYLSAIHPKDFHGCFFVCDDKGRKIKCPYGQVGDRLWVRETWRIESFMDGEPLLFNYKDGQTMEENEYSDTLDYESWYERVCIQSTEDAERAFKQGLVRQDEGDMYRWDIGKSPCRWRPSIHMPRWASRITLKITDIRVERLQEITVEDCYREGYKPSPDWDNNTNWKWARIWFSELWDSLNAKRGYGWETNPWVWVISFKRIDSGHNREAV